MTAVDLTDIRHRLEALQTTMDSLAGYQRDANGKLGDLSVVVANHAARLDGMKDVKGRWFSVAAAFAVAVFSWLLHAGVK